MARKFNASITNQLTEAGAPIRYNLGKFPSVEAAQSAVNEYLGALLDYKPVFRNGSGIIKSTASATLGRHMVDVVIQ